VRTLHQHALDISYAAVHQSVSCSPGNGSAKLRNPDSLTTANAFLKSKAVVSDTVVAANARPRQDVAH
jgi:hypothetical protein